MVSLPLSGPSSLRLQIGDPGPHLVGSLRGSHWGTLLQLTWSLHVETEQHISCHMGFKPWGERAADLSPSELAIGPQCLPGHHARCSSQKAERRDQGLAAIPRASFEALESMGAGPTPSRQPRAHGRRQAV